MMLLCRFGIPLIALFILAIIVFLILKKSKLTRSLTEALFSPMNPPDAEMLKNQVNKIKQEKEKIEREADEVITKAKNEKKKSSKIFKETK